MIGEPMNRHRKPNRRTATQNRIMHSADDREPSAAQFSGAAREKCLVCDDPIRDRCFCKIHRKEGGPILLCCPSCAVQYIDSARPPADSREEELRANEKSTHFFIGEDKPWS
jgi:hypothetical protein